MTEIIIFVWIITGMALYMIHPDGMTDSFFIELIKVTGSIIFAPVIIMNLLIQKVFL